MSTAAGGEEQKEHDVSTDGYYLFFLVPSAYDGFIEIFSESKRHDLPRATYGKHVYVRKTTPYGEMKRKRRFIRTIRFAVENTRHPRAFRMSSGSERQNPTDNRAKRNRINRRGPVTLECSRAPQHDVSGGIKTKFFPK